MISHEPDRQPGRKRVADLLAKAEMSELNATWADVDPKPAVQPIRGPETGLVMIKGRIGGGGSPFNLGEATVTRATVRLETGTVGHAHALGTDREKVQLAAIFEALWQEAETQSLVEERLLKAIEARLAAADSQKAEETAATRVDFFTMVRGED
ncbi:phosphonate C-P lyase system protein PhnG [Oryzifoliimicrobium ureilyticus]|uniref:phosphonate C-P lyase system protein PhnG n=1 Tax=Oryzifoliimicrobium ureilyticus TaxID=3113724 RepID=UPI0030760784